MGIKNFDPATTPLLTGINLIEASAGTGKTYAIAMLALRFVVEQGLPIDQLLVVTFTKAATEELKDRIRKRLSEAKRALDIEAENIDETLSDWLNTLSIEKSLVKQRIQIALLDIDQAGIFTIHSFCQRVLREHALESSQLFNSELTGNIDTLRQACADDYWRRHVYPRSVQQAAILTLEFKTPEALLTSIMGIPATAIIHPDSSSLDEKLADLEAIFFQVKDALPDLSNNINNIAADDKFKADVAHAYQTTCQQLNEFLVGTAHNIPTLENLSMLTTAGLKLALNGHKFRKTKAQSSDERKQEYLDTQNVNTTPFDKLVSGIQHVNLTFRRNLVDYLNEHLDQKLEQLNTVSFDQLISRLAEVLTNDKKLLLSKELQSRFKAALIDEFQDTDQAQWQIFSTIFAHPEHYLYLIGDPKQAIYKFRGADIFSYFAAQDKAKHHFTLGNNWRSSPNLVAAVNAIFSQRPAPFVFDQLEFKPVDAALKTQVNVLNTDSKTSAPMQLWQLPPSETKTGYWTAGKAAIEIQMAVVNEIVQLLNAHLKMSVDGDLQRIKPADIAVLVRSNNQAREYQNNLRQAHIPAVINSTNSVFETQEAINLLVLLQAIAHPGNFEYLRQTMTLDWFALNGKQLYRILNNETEFDNWLNRFQNYYQLWQNQGLMAMMYELMARENIPEHIASKEDAERQLTNLHHLIELLQEAVLNDHLSILKTLDWLTNAINKQEHSDEQQLRLESDAEAVNIVTMHRAKGLEYPVVFCPYLWQRNAKLQKEANLVKCHDNGSLIADLGSEKFSEHQQKAIQEELAEDIRLLYVAVTRAQYRCYVVWADVRSNTTPNSSALAYLLFSEPEKNMQADFDCQQLKLKSICNETSEAFQYRLLETSTSIEETFHTSINYHKLSVRQQQRSLYTSWQMSSYTALSALSEFDTPELPVDKAQEKNFQPGDEAVLELPKGAHTGNVIHELLEVISFKTLLEAADYNDQRDKACLQYGLTCKDPNVINNMLKQVVQTPLSDDDPEFILANMADQHCLKEMPFYLAIRDLNVLQINSILKHAPTFQSLSTKQLSGFLTGFIDLICEYKNRFYVMDYKSNWLPDYRTETLMEAMREHNYGLQYWLYSVVLHRYLKNRLPDYHYDEHFGGVRYLFVRGMNKKLPMSGIYQDRPALEKIEALSKIF